MNAAAFYTRILTPAAEFAATLDPRLDSPATRLQMLATAGYESGWQFRAQYPVAIALGFWMDQQNAVQLLLDNPMSGGFLREGAPLLCIGDTAAEIHAASQYNDAIAYLIARLLAWCDPHPVPAIGDEEGCWQAYLRAQNPGAVSRARWAEVYPQCLPIFEPPPAGSAGATMESI